MFMRIKSISFVIFLLMQLQVLSQDKNWVNIGPEGGIIKRIKTAPSAKNVVYCGMQDGSVFRSDNSGMNWNLIGWFAEGVSCLDVHPLDSKIVYLGTNSNLYITTDDGSNWHTGGWNNGGITCLSIDPLTPKNIYLSSLGNYGGIWKSTNSGDSWSFIHFPDTQGMTFVICVDPINNNFAYAVSNSNKMYRSTDNGDTWQIISTITGFPNDLEINQSSPSILYLASSEGVFITTDSGRTWSEKNDGAIDRNHPWTDNILINPLIPTQIFRNTNETAFVSNFQGEAWKATGFPAGSMTIASDSIVLSGTEEGVYAWNTNAENLHSSNKGLLGTTIKSLQGSAQTSPVILAATENQGLANAYLYINQLGSTDWTKYYWGHGISELKASPFNSQLIIGGFGGFQTGVKVSLDGGKTWQLDSIATGVYTLEFSNYNSSTIFAGGQNGLNKSSDLGAHWSKINTPAGYYSVNHISTEKNDSLIYLCLGHGIDWNSTITLLSSTNSGTTWYDHNLSATCVLIWHNNPDIILCGTSNNLLRSSNAGSTWDQIQVSGQSVYIHKIISYKNKLLFIGTNKGVFYSGDAGISWLKLGADLLHENVLDISFSEGLTASIIIGTQGGGVYKQNIDYITSLDQIVHNNPIYTLSNNYPNPFNPTTTIKYSVPKLSFVSIKVYDVLGRLVKTLVNENKPAGNYNVTFDGSNFVSGVYFYRMESGSFSQTMKLLLLK